MFQYNIIISLIIGYLLGSVPTGYLLARCWKGIDIRQYGSGNIGATNVWRTLGAAPGLVVLLIDMAKGAAAVLIARYFGGTGAELAAAVGALLGHSYPLFLKFRGGKIIATGAGIIFTISPLSGLVGLVLFASAVILTRYVSVASMTAAVSIPVSFYLLHMERPYIVFAAAVAAFAIYKHRSNIKRLITGTEFKIGQKKF
ncbi:glycerol-3-phosphate acyltransferase PlsY [Desulfohalotomaculum tongense]|uniref:glycerol-3-phosphate 1-O-acyltransferase PlsY n=1 Tax=Desulforadius tongensis TaxID=1216062 RepID=UPI00195A3CD4|nr:glycerol-3-phosphate acyltransferase PlsY [Desulforadius tongensis]